MTAPHSPALTIRFATPADAEALVAIYAPYILKTAITYEYEVPTIAEFARRIETYSAKYPYLVAELDGTPVGYAYACPLGSRPAFDWAVETAIYIREDCKGSGDRQGSLRKAGDHPPIHGYSHHDRRRGQCGS